MSEYQYYEFAAIDQPLTRAQMAELRAVSTRAVINPGGFSNHYEWGDLKADPAQWMREYFDAYVYYANWFSCQLSLRLPKAALKKSEIEPYLGGAVLEVDASRSHWIFNWHLEEGCDEERFAQDEGSVWMRRLTPLRDELLRGDLRSLYLGWLAAGDECFDEENAVEVPAGLNTLTPAQQALVEFLEIDADLLAAACADSVEISAAPEDDASMAAWLATWQMQDMQQVLKRIAQNRTPEAERQVKQHYATWQKSQRPTVATGNRRCMLELQELADSSADLRRAREAQARAERETALRQQYEASLRQMMASSESCWQAAHEHALRSNPAGYEQVVRLLKTLAEGYALVAMPEPFEQRLQRFLQPFSRRPALMRRLSNAGLCTA